MEVRFNVKLLLHTCCAPCLEYPSEVLFKENQEYTAYFFNPNIHPEWEYQRRKKTLIELSKNKNINVMFSDVSEDLKYLRVNCFEKLWKKHPVDKRCEMCYRIRLEKTAKIAKEEGYDMFSTTLLGSIYQNYDLICKIGYEMGQKYGVEFFEKDFREGFRKGQQIAKDEGLYRQKYCGCIVSLDNSFFKDKIINSFLFEKK